jgi:hypothetical protein
MGAWLTIGVIMNRTPKLLVAMLLAALALIRSGRSATVIHDWGEESYVRRAGEMLDVLRADLQDKVPSPEPHSRLYFHRVPSEVGFLIGDGPSLRVWYDDSTLRGGFWRDFRVRDRHEAPGPDCFFRYDTLACWVEVASGAEDVAGSRQRNPDWFSDHVRLARTLSNGEDWAAAFREYSKLSEVRPDDPSIAFMAGLSALARGDSVQAKHWIGRAALSASADAEIRATARALGLPIPHLHSESR